MPSIDDILGPDGVISEALPNWEHRPQQLEMARAVERSFDDRTPLVVEAATGTGKTLAYLIPALLSGKRVVISTGTKALQEQLFYKDIPFVAEHWHEEIEAVLLKGRRNYLCKLRFDSMNQNPAFRTKEDAQRWPKIKKWADETRVGDRAEIEGAPDDWPMWGDLSVGSEGCLGTDCDFYDDCFVVKARRRASTARVVVVNHHLFFADLALKQGGHAELLPAYDAVIFDEAHHIESVATSYFGLQISNYKFNELTGDIERALDDEDLDDPELTAAVDELDRAQKTFLSDISFGLYEGRYELEEHLSGPVGDMIGESYKALREALKTVESEAKRSALYDMQPRLSERAGELRGALEFVMRRSDPKFVYFIELRDHGRFLQAMPIDLAELLRGKLLDTHDTIVFTSATLSTGGTFDYFKQRMGVSKREEEGPLSEDYRLEELLLPAVFDYEEQAIIYVPNRLPEPNHPDWLDGFCTIVDYLTGLTEGRAFLLFTSYRNMEQAWDRLSDELPWECFKQGDAPKRELLERFRAVDNPVLFATSSFWEGVDVVGEKLSLVVIDKLPFANPSDPLIRARQDFIDEQGGSSFRDFSLPQAALTLKQGFGRLIRSRDDRGVVAILDSRIARRGYGRYFLDSLPPAPVVWRAAGVKSWW